jgi:hypothetical protein
MAKEIIKDPNATRVYDIDWTPVVGTKTLDSSQWIEPGVVGEPVVDAQSFSGQTVTVKFSGGTDGQDYEFINRVGFGDGESDDQTFILRIRQG